MLENVKVSTAPHVRDKSTTTSIMLDVIIALLPAAAFGIYNFGFRAYLVIMVCILSCLGFEAGFQLMCKRKITVLDLSAVVTGLLLALNLPHNIPFWMAIIGSFFAIIIVKQLFGGIGQNFMNPALAARCFLLLSFTKPMTNFIYDGVTTATPLNVIKSGGEVDLLDAFLGFTGGSIGETSVVAILLGAFYLLAKRIIGIKIPGTYIGTFAICFMLYGLSKGYGLDVFEYTAIQLCSGGLMLGAFFMATDYVTSPITAKGKIVFGVILGVITFVMRAFGAGVEGVSYAIIFSNLLVPLIEKFTKPTPFGYQVKKDNSDKKGIIKTTAALALITFVVGILLSVVYGITKEPINQAKIERKEAAYEEIFKGSTFETNTKYDVEIINKLIIENGFENSKVIEVLDVNDSVLDSKLGHIIVIAAGNGYAGNIEMAVGVTTSGQISGIKMLSINETVGLGLNAKEQAFLEQFYDKDVKAFEYTKTKATQDNEIDALSGATITTNAVVETVNAAISLANYYETGSFYEIEEGSQNE